jgi:hypothetical protein
MATRRKSSKGHEERAHAPLPPSASKRWLTCAPSQGYIRRLIELKKIKKRVSGPAAQRGTRIHEIAEPWLKASIVEKRFKLSTKHKVPKNAAKDEVAEAKAYVEFCLRKWEAAIDLDPGAQCGIENKSLVTADCWGSCDFWIFAAKRFTSIDLKSGREEVVPSGNTQLLIYALGIIRARKLIAREVELCIWQPNADHDMPEKGHVYKQSEFVAFAKTVEAGIEDAAWYINTEVEDLATYEAKLVAGDHCDWCDALGVCPAARARNLSISSKNFTPVAIDKAEPPPPATLEPEQISEIMRRAPMFVAWLEAVQVRALELMHKGQKVPGFKVVQKLTRRAWDQKYTDAQIAKGLGLNIKEVTKTIRLSPAQVEENLDKAGKEKLKRFVFKPEGEATVVADSDRRVPLLATKINFTPVSKEERDE